MGNYDDFIRDCCTSSQYEKFNYINSLSDSEWEQKCILCNDCSICDMAIHEFLLSVTRHICVYGMSIERFESIMSDADSSF